MQELENEALLGPTDQQTTPGRAPPEKPRRPAAKCRPPVTARTGSSMIENFSEFLASRNVINQTGLYDKIPSNKASTSSSTAGAQRVQLVAGEPLLCLSATGHPSSCRLRQHQKRPAPPLKLLASLIRGKERNKSMAFISLLRAPAVLGALFSLALTASLTTLYTMTYHAHSLSLASSSFQPPASGADMSPSPEEVAKGALRRALTVQTECGQVVGELEDRAIVFRGIPYATPPTDSARLAAPQAAARDHCIQLSPFKRRITGSEDCLYLDIYSAQLDPSKKLPVMLYIHGGFLAFGSSGRAKVNWMKARPSGELASELNVILVAFNFRLQALGFVRPTPPGASKPSSGSPADIEAANYGLWDQLVALKWVKRNIEAFGGDPSNVVLFGPDSASALPLALMSQHNRQQTDDMSSSGSSDMAAHDGLFRAAWLTNPALFFDRRRPLDNGDPFGGSMLNYQATNCSSKRETDQLDCLMRLSAEQVIQAYLLKEDPAYRLDDQNSMPVHGVFTTQLVSIDNELVQDSFPFSRSTNGSHVGIAVGRKDLLIGSSAQAVEYWPCPRNLSNWSKSDLEHYTSTSLASFHGDTYKQALELYASAYNDTKHLSQDQLARLIYLSMVTDIRQICPANQLEQTLRDLGHSVERYIVETPYLGEQVSSPLPLHAFHYWDLIAFFGFQFDERFTPNLADLRFQANIRSMVRSFVHRTQDENTGTGHILYAKDASVSREPSQSRQTECNMWRSQLGYRYSWIS